jgi:hypothetical protein
MVVTVSTMFDCDSIAVASLVVMVQTASTYLATVAIFAESLSSPIGDKLQPIGRDVIWVQLYLTVNRSQLIPCCPTEPKTEEFFRSNRNQLATVASDVA